MSEQTGGTAAGRAAGLLCPNCRVNLVMSERQGVEIDYCPQCRGVWLDRGELDKILERSAAELSAAAQPQQPSPPPPSAAPPDYRRDHDRDRYRHSDEYEYRHPKRRKSFLEDLFD
jgi:Zn-finger nucleic acid-binding protein